MNEDKLFEILKCDVAQISVEQKHGYFQAVGGISYSRMNLDDLVSDLVATYSSTLSPEESVRMIEFVTALSTQDVLKIKVYHYDNRIIRIECNGEILDA